MKKRYYLEAHCQEKTIAFPTMSKEKVRELYSAVRQIIPGRYELRIITAPDEMDN